MKIVITGGTGFLGRHLVWRFASEGHEIIFTGRQPKAAADVMARVLGKATWLPLNHGEPNASHELNLSAKDADAVIHCAALSSPWGQYKDFVSANLESTEQVIAACDTHSIRRLIHISTPSIYFNYQDQLNISENHPLPTPVNDYAKTKWMAEELVQSAKIPERVILRPRGIFGPWDNTLMPRLLRVIERGAIPLVQGGKALLDLTYVGNLVDAVSLSLNKPLLRPTSTYNVTNGQPLALVELLQLVAENFQLNLRTRKVPWWLMNSIARSLEIYSRMTNNSEPLITRYGAGVISFNQTLDISAIKRELGYQPKISNEAGIARHAAWHKDRKGK